MYPADKLNVEGGYTSDDLPDAVDMYDDNDPPPPIHVGTLTKNNPPLSADGIPPYPDGAAFVYYGSVDGPAIILFAGVWNYWSGGSNKHENGCLTTDYSPTVQTAYIDVQDQFNATYTISPTGQSDITVTRVSLCVWEGSDNFGRTAQLLYSPTDGSLAVDNKWVVTFTADDIYFESTVAVKADPQSSPVGEYKENPSSPVAATVA
jgi:hypothetical protein